MLRFGFSIVLIIHGLISGSQALGSFGKQSVELTNPSWLKWWPTQLGQSWLFAKAGSKDRVFSILTGFLWLIAMAGFLATSLALFGFIQPIELWKALVTNSAIISLIVLLLYLHPLYLIGVLINVGILILVNIVHWSPIMK